MQENNENGYSEFNDAEYNNGANSVAYEGGYEEQETYGYQNQEEYQGQGGYDPQTYYEGQEGNQGEFYVEQSNPVEEGAEIPQDDSDWKVESTNSEVPGQEQAPADGYWLCDRCTYSNPVSRDNCEMCTRTRPASSQGAYPKPNNNNDDDGSDATEDFADPNDRVREIIALVSADDGEEQNFGPNKRDAEEAPLYSRNNMEEEDDEEEDDGGNEDQEDEEEDEDEDGEEDEDEEEDEEEAGEPPFKPNQKFTLGQAFQQAAINQEAQGGARDPLSETGNYYLNNGRGQRQRRVSYAMYVKEDGNNEGLGEDFLETAWKVPSHEEAEANAKQHIVKGGKASILFSNIDEMPELGVGVQLYMRTVKYLMFTFLFASIVYSPVMWLHGQNELGIAAKDMDYFQFAKYCVGNLGFNDALATNEMCEDYGGNIDCSGERMALSGLFFGVQSIARTEASMVVMAFEVFITLWFLTAFRLIQSRLRESIKETEEEVVHVSDYAVWVEKLPLDATVDDVMEHFNNLYSGDKLSDPRPVLLNFAMENIVGFLGMLTGGALGFGLAFCIVILIPQSGITLNEQGGTIVYAVCIPIMGFLIGFFFRRTFKQEQTLRWTQLAEYGEDQEAVDNDLGDTLATAPSVVKVPTNTGLGMYVNKWIAEISIIHKNAQLLRKSMRYRKKLQKVKVARAKVKRFAENTEDPKGPNAKAFNKQQKILDKQEKKLAHDKESDITDKDYEQIERLTGAFIIFNNVESAERCLDDYRFSHYWITRLFQPRILQFSKKSDGNVKPQSSIFSMLTCQKGQKKHKISVCRAPEPSTIQWENLSEIAFWRIIRRVTSVTGSIILLLISFFAIFYAREIETIVNDALPALEMCDAALPALFMGTYDYSYSIDLVRDDDNNQCAENEYYIMYEVWNNVSQNALPEIEVPSSGVTGNSTYISRTQVETLTNTATLETFALCDSPCSSKADDGSKCYTLPCAVPSWSDYENGGYECESFASSNVLTGCYCNQEINDAISSSNMMRGLKQFLNDDLCGEVANLFIFAWLVSFAASLTITVINSILQFAMHFLGRFERHKDLSDESAVVGRKVFYFTYVNTAVLLVICNARLGSTEPWTSIFNGDYSNFTREWYTSVGVTLTMTMLINIISPHIAPFMTAIFGRRIKILLTTRNPSTQFQMNDSYKYPRWRIETRVAQVLCLVFVTLTYSGGIPLLYWLCTGSLLVTYWVDKYMLLRLCLRPPHYGPELMQMIISHLPWAILLHLAVTCYMHANDELLASTYLSASIEESFINEKSEYHWILDEIYPRVLRKNVFPLFFIFMVYIAWLLVLSKLKKFLLAILKYMFGCLLFKSSAVSAEYQADGERKPKYTGFFMQLMNTRQYFDYNQDGALRKSDADEGWVALNENTIYQLWKESGKVDDIPHFKEHPKKTFEYLSGIGDYSYLIRRSERYQAALAFLTFKLHAAKRNEEGDAELNKVDLLGFEGEIKNGGEMV